MRLILFDRPVARRRNFYPLALSRPIWELRCGISTLGEKLVSSAQPAEIACWLPDYLAGLYRRESAWAVNDPRSLAGDDLLLAAANVKADQVWPFTTGPSRLAADAEGEIVLARITRADLAKLSSGSLDALLVAAQHQLPTAPVGRTSESVIAAGTDSEVHPTWNYSWELVLANGGQLTEDFRALGRSGIEGTIEEPWRYSRHPRRPLHCSRR